MSGLANANLLANSEVKNGERGPCGMIFAQVLHATAHVIRTYEVLM